MRLFVSEQVGPLCDDGNARVLTHDFVHKTHLEVFEGRHYPKELTDWWLDDWISGVYGGAAADGVTPLGVAEVVASVKVRHWKDEALTRTRYVVDRAREALLPELLRGGRERVAEWVRSSGGAAGCA